MDDFLIVAQFRDLCDLHTCWTANLLVWLGFSINKKLERTPRQSIVYLGVLNLHSLSIALPPPPEQVANVASQSGMLLQAKSITRRQLEAVVGLINFAGPMLCFGKLFIMPIIWMNAFSSMSRRDSPIWVTDG